ncbi:MAG TPA: hypothetical protein VFG56_01490, partial [Candidatus Saccharimonadales bacterium]|nr:hypothetical protein [Candidatus Saccharimonadales bacterium]
REQARTKNERVSTDTPEDEVIEPEIVEPGAIEDESEPELEIIDVEAIEDSEEVIGSGETAGTKVLSDQEMWAWDYAAEHLKAGYLYDDSEEVSETRQKLNQARLKLAEVSVKARRGKLFGFKKKRLGEKLTEAEAAYDEAKQAFLEEEVTEFGRAKQAGQKEAYLAALSAHEDGALMATEANYFMSKENSKTQKSLEWYKSLSKKERLAYGIGASAVVGVLGGITLGFAAAGAMYGSRVGKGYLNREARRADKIEVTDEEIARSLGDRKFVDDEQKKVIYKSTRKKLQKSKLQASKFEKSTLRQSNQDQHDELLGALNDYKKPTKKTLLSAVKRDTSSRRETEAGAYEAALNDAEAEKRAKRKSLYSSVGFAALGGGIGALIEYGPDIADYTSDHTWGGVRESIDEHTEEFSDKVDDLKDEIVDLQHDVDTNNQHIEALEDQNDHLQDKLDDLKDVISDRSEYLYGEFAGQQVDISIPAGGTVWDQLEAQVNDQYPHASYTERERIVGNLLNSLKDKYPTRNFNIVQAGDHFSFTPNPQA